jgi:cephalosporin hydroxylase
MGENSNLDPIMEFEREREERLRSYAGRENWHNASAEWMRHAFENHYMYNYQWMGRPIIQIPSDICAIQELIWKIRPDVIVETGIAHGGSLLLSSSILALLDYTDAATAGVLLDPARPKRKVIAVDIDIRPHNKIAIESHSLSSNIFMIQGSSTDHAVVEQVHMAVGDAKSVLVCLDSNHTHDHVLKELGAYAGLVTTGSYCVVFDTVVENLPEDFFPDRPWKPGDNPKTAITTWLKTNADFEIDTEIDNKLMISAAPGGYLRRK